MIILPEKVRVGGGGIFLIKECENPSFFKNKLLPKENANFTEKVTHDQLWLCKASFKILYCGLKFLGCFVEISQRFINLRILQFWFEDFRQTLGLLIKQTASMDELTKVFPCPTILVYRKVQWVVLKGMFGLRHSRGFRHPSRAINLHFIWHTLHV